MNTPPIKSWSFSLLKDFEACPYRVYLMRVERAPRPAIDDDPNHPLTRGNRVHEEIEHAIRGDGPITREAKKVSDVVEDLREKFPDGIIEVEQEWGFNAQWEVVDWRDPQCWARVKCDVVEHMSPDAAGVDDWKTGKSFGNEVKHRQQSQLYGVATFMRYPKLITVRTRMIYTDEGKIVPGNYSRAALPTLLDRWTARAMAMTTATHFPAKPNRGNCRFCPYGVEVGTGACAYAVGLDR